MFQRRHYEAIAAAMREVHPGRALSADNRAITQWNATREYFAEMLAQDNPRFDLSRFTRACERI